MVESRLAMWAADGERTEDLDPFRQDKALALLLGHALPAAQTARDFLAQLRADDRPLLQEGQGAGCRRDGAAAGSGQAPCRTRPRPRLRGGQALQSRRPVRTATLDVDATLIRGDKRAAKRPYDGNRGYQPVLALWAEQAGILADEFRDGKSLPSCLMGWMAPSRHLCAKVRLS